MGKIESETAAVIEAQRKSLSKAIVDRQYAGQPETWTPYGKRGK